MLQEKVTTLTDKRLRLIYDVISGIRVLKMNAWEWCFRDLVSGIRRYVFRKGKWDKIPLSLDALATIKILFSLVLSLVKPT